MDLISTGLFLSPKSQYLNPFPVRVPLAPVPAAPIDPLAAAAIPLAIAPLADPLAVCPLADPPVVPPLVVPPPLVPPLVVPPLRPLPLPPVSPNDLPAVLTSGPLAAGIAARLSATKKLSSSIDSSAYGTPSDGPYVARIFFVNDAAIKCKGHSL